MKLTLTLTVEQVPDEDAEGELIWEARIAEFPDICGFDKEHPYEAADVAVDAAICIWFDEQSPVTTGGE